MAILLKTASVRVSSIQIMQVIVQNKGKSVWKSRYGRDVSWIYDQLIYETRLVFLAMGEVLSFGFNLVVSSPSDKVGVVLGI